jgi:hypothetical protein
MNIERGAPLFAGIAQADPALLEQGQVKNQQRLVKQTHPPDHKHTTVICYHHNAALCLFQQIGVV